MSILKQKLHGLRGLAAAVLLVYPACAAISASSLQQQPDVSFRSDDGRSLRPSTEPPVVASAAENGDRDTLQKLLRHGSISEQTAAFDALRSSDPVLAADLVASDFRAPESASRLHSLYLIDRSQLMDDQTANAFLREALHDTDTAVSEYALEALARRTQPDHRVFEAGNLGGPDSESKQLALVKLAALDQDSLRLHELLLRGNSAVQSAAFEALAVDDSSQAAAELESVFRDKTALNRMQALDLLVRSSRSSSHVIDRILREAADDADPVIKSYATGILGARAKEAAEEPTALNTPQSQ